MTGGVSLRVVSVSGVRWCDGFVLCIACACCGTCRVVEWCGVVMCDVPVWGIVLCWVVVCGVSRGCAMWCIGMSNAVMWYVML